MRWSCTNVPTRNNTFDSSHLDKLSWIWSNKSLIFLLSTACLVKCQIYSLGFNPVYHTLTSILNITLLNVVVAQKLIANVYFKSLLHTGRYFKFTYTNFIQHERNLGKNQPLKNDTNMYLKLLFFMGIYRELGVRVAQWVRYM